MQGKFWKMFYIQKVFQQFFFFAVAALLSSLFAYSRFDTKESPWVTIFGNTTKRWVLLITLVRVFVTIFRNSLKNKFLLILGIFALNNSLSTSLLTMKCQKNARIFISQYRCVETNLYLMGFNIEIYQKRAFY